MKRTQRVRLYMDGRDISSHVAKVVLAYESNSAATATVTFFEPDVTKNGDVTEIHVHTGQANADVAPSAAAAT